MPALSTNANARPSPAVAFVGRKNSGKTTLTERLIKTLCARGLDIASIKHHGHPDFDIDVPGKDSYRHRQAGAKTTAVLSDARFALMEDTPQPLSCQHALALMPGHDLVIVEGFRRAGLPTIEVFRAANERDQAALPPFLDELERLGRQADGISAEELREARKQLGLPYAVATDIDLVARASENAGIPALPLNDIEAIADFVERRFVRAPMTIAIQAGGESKRMGRSKARTPFLGRPLIEHMLDLISPMADEVIVTTNERAELAYLADEHPNLRLVTDILPTRGALPGLLTALEASTHDLTAVVACDMIAFAPRILFHEAHRLQAEGCDCIVPRQGDYWEPFAAVYRSQTCAKAVAYALEKGTTRIKDFFISVDCLPFDASPWQQRGRINPFANVNTPEELAQAEILFKLYG